MKLGSKIILPILLLLVIIIGAFGYLHYKTNQQEVIISKETSKIQKLNSLNERLSRQQAQTDSSVLSYRFNPDKTSLDAINQAELDKSKTLDEMFPFITTEKGRELINSYFDSRKGIESSRNELIKAIDGGNNEQIDQSFDKWNIKTQNIQAALADIKTYNINSLEKTLVISKDIRNLVTQIIIYMAIVVFTAIVLLYFYLRSVLTVPIIKLSAYADQLAKIDFSSSSSSSSSSKNNSNDEIGMLYRSFYAMSMKLKSYYGELEQKVKVKTEELNRKVLDLENAKKATMNLMEDLQAEQKKTDTLVKDLEKFKLALDNTSDNIMITDPEGIIVYGNRAIEKTTGYKSKETLGKKAGVLWKTPMSAPYYQKMWNTIKKQKITFEGEIQNKRKNGEVYTAFLSISPILNAEGEIEYFVGLERDISREKEVDRMKSEFISLASHQLRTPLTAAKWFGEMLLSGDAGKLEKVQQEYVQNIYTSNERMIALVNALLNISRMESGRIMMDPQPTDLGKLVKEIIAELNMKINEKKQNVSVSIQPNLPKINIDPKLVRQIYINLLTNSIKYTPDKGKISVIISKKADEIISQVKDTGLGIPAKDHDRVFSKFFRAENITKVETDGSGLGLYLVKTIVESANGKIWFESTEGKGLPAGRQGTSFWFSLPLKGVPAQKGEVALEN